MATSAAAMPGAIALTLTSPLAAMAAKVIITPTTVPSRPRNGPPAMAIVSSTMLEASFCVKRTCEASMVARIASIACGVKEVTARAPTDLAPTRLASSSHATMIQLINRRLSEPVRPGFHGRHESADCTGAISRGSTVGSRARAVGSPLSLANSAQKSRVAGAHARKVNGFTDNDQQCDQEHAPSI